MGGGAGERCLPMVMVDAMAAVGRSGGCARQGWERRPPLGWARVRARAHSLGPYPLAARGQVHGGVECACSAHTLAQGPGAGHAGQRAHLSPSSPMRPDGRRGGRARLWPAKHRCSNARAMVLRGERSGLRAGAACRGVTERARTVVSVHARQLGAVSRTLRPRCCTEWPGGLGARGWAAEWAAAVWPHLLACEPGSGSTPAANRGRHLR